jgi:hypothetical protein
MINQIMKKHIAIILIYFISQNNSIGQVTNMSGGFTYFPKHENPKSNIEAKIVTLHGKDTAMVYKFLNDFHEETYLGTPFFKNTSFDNELVYIDGFKTKGRVLYDLLSDKIQFSTDDFKTSNVIKPDSFTISTIKLTKLDHLFSNAYKTYYEEIYNDDYNQVFKRYICEIKSTRYINTGYDTKTENVTGKFVKSSEYFFVRANRLEHILKSNKFCKQLGLFQKDLEWFAEAKKLKFDNDKDIIELMKYYNTLFNN